jgi:hypothetical protein
MLDDMLDYLEQIRQRPVWQPIPEDVRGKFRTPLPWEPTELTAVHEEFLRDVLPYAAGNVHPGFMGWVQGGGTPVGMLAEMLAAGMNANLGGRNHMPIEVERQIVRWMCELFGFAQSATGLFVTGTSMANLMAVAIARDVALGFESRSEGVGAGGASLRAYASAAVHGCMYKAMDVVGLGSGSLRQVPVDARQRIDLAALTNAIDADRRAGLRPFLIVGTAGTVDTGAIDDLTALAEVARREGIWFHIDGACGALGILAPEVAPRLAGIERADSLAFDFHKWGQVPYDAGFLLVRDGVLHRKAFASTAVYLRRADRGRRRMALRLRPGPFARFPRLENLVHVEGLWPRGAGRRGRAHVRTGALSRRTDRGATGIRNARSGGVEHRMLPLSGGGGGPGECANRDGLARCGRSCTLNHSD